MILGKLVFLLVFTSFLAPNIAFAFEGSYKEEREKENCRLAISKKGKKIGARLTIKVYKSHKDKKLAPAKPAGIILRHFSGFEWDGRCYLELFILGPDSFIILWKEKDFLVLEIRQLGGRESTRNYLKKD